jgi:chromosome partitioning protein
VRTIAFFNNKGGVSKTSLVYHLAWKYADLGYRVLAVDLDPQSNLSSMMLEEDRLEQLWEGHQEDRTIFNINEPWFRGLGDLAITRATTVAPNLDLIVGDMRLGKLEDKLSQAWPRCQLGDESSLRETSSLWRSIKSVWELSSVARPYTVALLDLGPNLGAINRSALLAADFVVTPLAPDLFSLQGLKNLVPQLAEWRTAWQQACGHPQRPPDLPLPAGHMEPLGYVVLQHAIRADRPTRAYDKWMRRIPAEFARSLPTAPAHVPEEVSSDPHCLALLKHYRSLMPMAQEARKPIFHLTPADGAIGGHAQAAVASGADFARLAERIRDELAQRETARSKT